MMRGVDPQAQHQLDEAGGEQDIDENVVELAEEPDRTAPASCPRADGSARISPAGPAASCVVSPARASVASRRTVSSAVRACHDAGAPSPIALFPMGRQPFQFISIGRCSGAHGRNRISIPQHAASDPAPAADAASPAPPAYPAPPPTPGVSPNDDDLRLLDLWVRWRGDMRVHRHGFPGVRAQNGAGGRGRDCDENVAKKGPTINGLHRCALLFKTNAGRPNE